MARTTPTVWVTSWGRERRAKVQLAGAVAASIALDTPAWVMWLETPTTTSFAYPIYDRQVGYICAFMTVRKERRQRGSHYWVAYRRSGGRLRKIYLGCSDQLSQQQLEGTAERFLGMETGVVSASGDDREANTGRR
jgi:hypothetical protein